jgi:hypothetical protein
MYRGEVYVIPPTLKDYLTYYVETEKKLRTPYSKHYGGYDRKYYKKMEKLREHFLGILDYWKKQDKEFYNYSEYIHCPKLYRCLHKLVNESKCYWNIDLNIKSVIDVYL